MALGTGPRILHILGKYSTELQLQPQINNFLLVLESKKSQDSLLVNEEHTLRSAGFGFKTTSNFVLPQEITRDPSYKTRCNMPAVT